MLFDRPASLTQVHPISEGKIVGAESFGERSCRQAPDRRRHPPCRLDESLVEVTPPSAEYYAPRAFGRTWTQKKMAPQPGQSSQLFGSAKCGDSERFSKGRRLCVRTYVFCPESGLFILLSVSVLQFTLWPDVAFVLSWKRSRILRSLTIVKMERARLKQSAPTRPISYSLISRCLD